MRFHATAVGKRFKEGRLGRSTSSSGEEGGCRFLMDDVDNLGCNAGPASDNASPMVGFEIFSDPVCAKAAEELEILSSIPHGDDVNIVSGVGRRGLEGKEESVVSASDLSGTANASMAASKLEDEIGVGKEAQKMVAGEEQDDLPDLFLLRGDGLGISPNLEVDCIDKTKDCSVGEDVLLVSSRSPKEVPLVAFDGDFARQGGSFLPNKFLDVYEISTGNWMEGRCETLAVAESDKVKSDMCCGKVTCGRREEVNQLCSMQNVKESPVQYSRKLKEMSDRCGRSCLVISEEERIEIPHFEQEASCSVQGAPSELTHCSALQGSFSEKPSHPLASAACCSKGSAEPDINEGNFDTFARSDGCSNGNDSRGEADRVSGTIDIFRRTNPKRGASLRSNLADEKFNQLFRIRSDRRKCRRKLNSSSFSSKLTSKIFSEVKRKRRDSERQARLSLWGELESLFHIIKQDCEFTKHDSQVTHAVRKSKKAKSGVVRRKGIPALRNGLSHLSESKSASSSLHITVNSQAFLQNGVNHIMLTSDGHVDSENSNRIVQLEQNSTGKMCNALVGSTQRSVQHGDKDLESSLTEETSVDNLQGEYYGILSKGNVKSVQETIDHKQLSDPGTSPDSLVYDPLMDVGVIVSEDSVSTKGGCGGMDQKIVIQDLKTEDGLPSAVPAFIEAFAAPSVSAKETHACLNPYRSKEVLKESRGKKGKNGKKDNKRRKEKKGKRNGPVSEYPQTFSDRSVEANVGSPGLNMSMKASSRSKCDLKEQHASIEGAKCSKSLRKHSEGGLKSERCSVDSSPGLPDLACFDQSVKVKEGLETSKMPLQIVSKGQQSEAILLSGDVKGHQLSRSAKMELHECIPSHGDSTWCGRQFKHGHHNGNRWKSDLESKEDILLGENGHIDFTLKITNKLAGHGGEKGSKIDGSDALFKDTSNNIAMPVSSGLSARELYHVLLDRSSLSGQKAWALCDECQKWRCIPEELVHAIENTKWTCKDNVDESFADCTIPQEKTNEVINKELEISDEEDFSTAQPVYWDTAPQRKTSAQRAAWTLIKSNSFLNRTCKKQTIDEIMVCYCKPPKDGGLGCHDECLNRMLNIECVKGTCPCGELCSNQQFQKRKYTKFKWIKCGKKGYGLQLEEDVSQGQFLIEYVGEVLDLAAYEARLRYYASRGHKHFYFMTLNGGEVIDACGKGNLGRFINHSCDPNCRTEKWMINGEVCIGLFAIRDIKKGEEVTFDYNYVRVFGAAAKKCVCGAAECQGYIGGDPSKSEVVVQDDSAEEDLEPLMIDEDGEMELAVKGTNSDATETKVIKLEDVSTERGSAQWIPSSSDQGNSVQNEDAMHQPSSEPNPIDPLQHSSDCIESGHTMFIAYSDIQESQDMKLVSSSIEPDEAFCASANDDQPLCTISEPLLPGQISNSSKDSLDSETDHSIQGSILDVSTKTSQNSDSTLHKKKLITYPIEENPSTSKPFDLLKSSHPIKIKRSKANIKSMASQKAKKVQSSMNNRHIEVEEKLNELLDVDGGISRHKDSAKWYLKLLVVTAAAGDDIKGGLSQSARDLSLILDAILKTKSRIVLVDIINKNGLQMLHNMMKHNRDNFNRIPILRKLLKVLEFLAEKQILTLEHINGGPPCNGVESFKESILKLMKHRDSQVQTIARNFSDHWIPHTARRFEPSDRDSRQLNSKCFHNSWAQASKFKPGHDHRKRENDATSLPTVPSVADINGEAYPLSYQQVSISASLAGSNLIDATRPRKRKSRWDQLSDVSTLGSQTLQSTAEAFSVFEAAIQKSGTVRAGNNSSNEAAPAADLMQQISDDDDMPPGFGFPCLDNHLQSSCMSKDVTREVVTAHTQEQYLPHLPVSFGMPIVLTQQLGTPEVEKNHQFDSSWKIEPAMPFKPFPPLPLYPRRETDWRNTGRTSNGIITAPHVKNEWQ